MDRPAIVAPPPVLALLCIAAGFVARYFNPLPIFNARSALRIAIPGTLVVMAIALISAGRRELVRNHEHPNPYRPTGAIVDTGIYGRTRNPLYLGFILISLAIAFAVNDAWLIGSAVAVFLALNFHVIAAEERYLSGKFGERYDTYRRTVRRWM